MANFATHSALPPHAGQAVSVAGDAAALAAPPTAAAILLHGRGASARDILSLAKPLSPGVQDHTTGQSRHLLFLAPQASGSSWYPQSFLGPVEANREAVHSAHSVIESLIEQLNALAIPTERIALVGFSQGACLASDHAYRFPRRYGAIIAFTGGLIGPPGTTFDQPGDLAGTPVFLGANDPDPHVPWSRVEETARVLRARGAALTLERYPNEPHAVLSAEIPPARAMLAALL